jgi:hypothetical protein
MMACWEREDTLAEEIKIAWKGHSKPKDLGDVASNLPANLEQKDSRICLKTD